MKTKLKRIMALILTFVIMLTTMAPSFALVGGQDVSMRELHTGIGYNVKYGKYQKHGEYLLYETTENGRTIPLYCIEFEKSVSSSKPNGNAYGITDSAPWAKLTREQQDNITLTAIYGYPNNNVDMNNAHERKMAQAATQCIIWEIEIGVRHDFSLNIPNNPFNNGKGYKNYPNAFKNSTFKRFYNEILTACANHFIGPSFNKSTVELGGIGEQYAQTLNDVNGVLHNYKIDYSSIPSSLNVSIQGDSLVVYANRAEEIDAMIDLYRTGKGCPLENSGFVIQGAGQALLYGHAEDPAPAWIKVRLSTGSLCVSKYTPDYNSDRHEYAGISFEVYGPNGYVDTITTDYDGYAYLNNIPVGNYTIKELTPNKFIPGETQYATIVPGQTTNVDFVNRVKTGDLEIVKTSEDNFVEGLQFHLYGTSDAGIDVNTYATTNSKGVAHFEDVYTGTYTVEEVNTPNKYVVPAPQTAVVKWGETTQNKFENGLKKFNVTVGKFDAEQGFAQGDATLAGAVYGLYKDGVLLDEYTTDEKGSFTTKDYVCGTGYSIKEIKPSNGYLLNPTVYNINPSKTSAENYTIEINPIAESVTEQVIKGDIAITKHTDEGITQIETPEKGAEFEVYLTKAGSYEAAKDTEKDTIVCDEYGYAQTKKLPYGTYTVHQTKGWEGREFMKDFTVLIDTEGHTYRYLINNANYKAYLKVVKTDAETGKTIPLAGATFQIYNPDGSLVEMEYTYPTHTKVNTFYTADDGTLLTPQRLPYGKGYKLVEVKAPEGYVLDSTPIEFDVTKNTGVLEDELVIVKVERPNMPQKGVINISKTGEIFSSVVENENMFTPVYLEGPLKGATYEIYAAEDIVTPDGTKRYSKDELVDTVIIGEDNFAHSKELYLGKYYVKETVAPEGYVIDTNIYNCELTYEGQDVSVTSTSVSNYDLRQKVTVSLSKIMEQDKTFNLGMNGEIKSVQFGLYASEDIVAADGTMIPKNGLITTAVCDENGKITFDCDLPIGFDFYVQEIATHDAYILGNTKYYFTTEYKGQETVEYEIKINNGESISNELIRGKVEITKTDAKTGEPLAEVGFKIYDKDKNLLFEGVTDENGKLSFDNLAYGDYFYQESLAPIQYVVDDTLYPFTISEDGQVIEVSMENRLKESKIILTKKDADNKEILLEGVKFVIKDADENIVGEFTTDENGQFEVVLPYGDYYYQEVECDDAYILDDTLYPFSVVEDGAVIEIEELNQMKKGTLIIKKVDSKDETILLSGITFVVEDKDGNIVKEVVTDENGEAKVELPYGDYVWYEKATLENYVLDNERHELKVTNNGAIFEYTISNKMIEGKLIITKVDANDTTKTLPGVTFVVEDANGNIVGEYVTDENGRIEITLPYGVYVWYEKSTVDGYVVNDERHELTITEDGQVEEVTVLNEQIPVVDAGADFGMLGLGSGLTGLSLVGFCISKKKKHNEE